MRKVLLLVAFGFAAGLCGCGPGGAAALALLALSSKKSETEKPRPPSAPTITTTTLPEGQVGVAYPATTLTATGGTTPYTWTDVNNTLQTYGLTLDASTGEIAGTPTQATPTGGVTVTIDVTDANNITAQKDFTLVIYPELQITTTSLPDGYEGQTGYSATLTATGGTGTYTWSITSGALPANLGWDATGATISGDIATGTAGVYPLQFEVTDGIQTVTADLTLTVHRQLQITTVSLPDAAEEVAYSCTFGASGGSAANYNWSISGQPSWLSIDAATGELSGTPPAGSAGTYTFTVQVTDGQQTASKQFDLVVKPAGSLTITTTTLPNGYEGQTGYNATLTATGGTGTYTWSMTSGRLPLNLIWDAATATISGDIATGTAGNYPLQFEVTDGIQTATVNLTLTVQAQLQITTASLPDATEGVAYSFTVTATGGNAANYSWSATGLPTGLDIDPSTGEISGTPAANTAGTHTVDVTVDDGLQNVSKQFDLTVNPATSPLTITTTSLPDATEGVAYSFTVQATGGNSSNYNWSISGQPSWLSINSSTGELSGTPPAGSAGIYTFTVEVTDGQVTASKQFDLLVKQGGGGTTLKADFEANPTYGKAPLTVNLTDKSTGRVTQWEWDFDGDGTVDSTVQNPTWTYNYPGWYTVRLRVSDGTNSDTCVKEKYILVASSVYYVDGAGGNDANGGTGWGDAFATIGKALSVAGGYDLVLVADATYNETDLSFSGKKICLKGVDHNTAGAQPVIDCQGKGRAFVFDSGEAKDSVIDNFTIRGGSAQEGGGVCCKNGSSPTVKNCAFNGNSASLYGGAIYCSSSRPTVMNCRFAGNSASRYGGAIACYNSSSPTITNCTFNDNSASDDGGAVYCYSSNPTLTGCAFSGNSASLRGGAVACNNSSNATLTDCIFSDNEADYGGAVDSISSSPSLMNCRFSGNSADERGGAIRCSQSAVTLTNCAFSGNSSDWYGGAIAFNSSSPTLTNCTFSGNSARFYGGAIYCSNSSSLTFNNCILWGDSASTSGDEIHAASRCTVTLNHCCVDNAGYGGVTSNITENNCIHDDPQFVCPEAGVLRLRHTSPCIDAGDNSLVPPDLRTDILGCPRIVGSSVDIGAYEHQGVIYVDPINGDDLNDGLS
ncbi:MAG: hypothetical protein DRP63_05170, partial [Planctomycetota bacterium]